ncbi:MAG: hypothetical protein AB7K71_03800 [Polyangiaceae bacterium]
MSDPVSGARSARENLAQGLAALQAPGVPPHLMNVAEPIAKAMSALHQIEASGGAAAPQHAPVALEAVRGALAQLQAADGVHPAVSQAMEAVASSLGLVHSLTQAPAAPAFQAAPAAAPAPQAFGSTVALDGPSTQPSQGVGSTVPIGSNTQGTGSTLELPPMDGAPAGIPRPTPQAAPQAYAQPPQQQAYAQPAPQAQPYQQPAPHQAPQQQAPQYQQPAPHQAPQQQAPQYQPPPQQQAPQYQQPAPHQAPQQQAPQYQQPPQQQAPQYQQPPQHQAPQYQQPPQQQAPQYQQPPQQAANPYAAAPAAYPQAQQAAPAQAAPAQPAPQARPPAAGPPAFGDILRLEAALGANSQTNFYKGLSGNDVIDDGGIFIATYQIPDMGQPLVLKVSMPGGYEFEAKAIVRWTREAPNSGADAPPGFGAAFTEISPEGRQLVYRYVRNREPLFHDDF